MNPGCPSGIQTSSTDEVKSIGEKEMSDRQPDLAHVLLERAKGGAKVGARDFRVAVF